ncbi:uncharacterized protein [Dermacentor albipictus]|uniref:uncharacterized protein isoform X3 n=1 Tax=Dermacentor albipictus TaxID=60249 RepID=UPI0038FD09A0
MEAAGVTTEQAYQKVVKATSVEAARGEAGTVEGIVEAEATDTVASGGSAMAVGVHPDRGMTGPEKETAKSLRKDVGKDLWKDQANDQANDQEKDQKRDQAKEQAKG